jgi:hypothetical protein
VDETPRFTFHPLERRGLLLGLGAGQLTTVGAGLLLAVVLKNAVAGGAGLVLAVTAVGGSLGAALWTKEGRPLVAHALLAATWLRRRPGRASLDPAPGAGTALRWSDRSDPAGHRAGTGSARRPPGRGRTSVTAAPGLALHHDEGLPGDGPVGVIVDRRAGTWGGVLPVRGGPLSLLDPSDQARQLEGWRQVLGSLCRTGCPVARLQWLQRSWTGSAGPGRLPAPDPRGQVRSGADAATSYREVQAEVGAAVVHHDAWVVLTVNGRRGGAGPAAGRRSVTPGPVVLRRELRLLRGQLSAAGLDPAGPLDLVDLCDLIGRPNRADGEAAGSLPWPLALEEGWAWCRADGMWHASFWIAEWPRVEVGPDFLAPLLLIGVRAALSVVMAPVPPDKALRQVRSARTADVADTELRARAGFLGSARRQREADGVERREAELADGHQELRFSGFLTVSAADPAQLVAACAEAEHAAAACRVELRRLYGRQKEAFTWTLPLGRGLR